MGIVRLRLARFGRKNRPFYRVVAIDARRPRNGRPIEYLGTYDPIPSKKDGIKEVRLKMDRVRYWLSVGAQPSDTVARLLAKAAVLPPPPISFQTKKHLPRGEQSASLHSFASSHSFATPPPTSPIHSVISHMLREATKGRE